MMFRAVKKRKPQRLVTTTTTTRTKDDDDEEEEDDDDENDDDDRGNAVLVGAVKKQQHPLWKKRALTHANNKSSFVARSFVVEEEEEEESDHAKIMWDNKKKKKTKRWKHLVIDETKQSQRGLGFGGSLSSRTRLHDDDDDEAQQQVHSEHDGDDSNGVLRYSKSALEQLKAEQRLLQQKQQGTIMHHHRDNDNNNNTLLQQPTRIDQSQQQEQQAPTESGVAGDHINNNNISNVSDGPSTTPLFPTTSQPLPDFMSLHGSSSHVRQNAGIHNDDDDNNHNQEPVSVVFAGDDAAQLEEEILAGGNVRFNHDHNSINETLDDDVDMNELLAERINAMSNKYPYAKAEEKKAVMEDEYDEATAEMNDWEQQLLRRAGLSTNTNNTKSNVQQQQQHQTRTDSTNNLPSAAATNTISQLRDQIQSTLANLITTQQDDVQVALERRSQMDLPHVQDELQRHGSELLHSGQALEYYQQLRIQLVGWVGALRDLQTKLQPLYQARIELEQDRSVSSGINNNSNSSSNNNNIGSSAMRQVEDDMVLVLHKAQLLQQVLGRQVPLDEDEDHTSSATHQVDEFGRDVKSQQVLQREQRYRRRKRIREQQQERQQRRKQRHRDSFGDDDSDDDNDSDAFLSDGEQHELDERRRALESAFQVAMEEMDEEYTDINNLIAIFVDWSHTYPEDYRNCFANLSLADLAGVLVNKNLNGSDTFHPLHWMDGNSPSLSNKNHREGTTAATIDTAASTFLWLKSLQQVEISSKSEKPDEQPLNLVVERVVIPQIVDLLDKSVYSLYSTRQSMSLAAMFGWIQDHLLQTSKNSSAFARCHKLKHRIVDYICQELQNVAIPILKANVGTMWNAMVMNSEEIQDAIRTATTEQVHRITKLLRNVLLYWAPHIAADSPKLTETVLEFCSTQLLYFLSSLRAICSANSSSGDVSMTNPSSLSLFDDVSPRECFAGIYSALQRTEWLDQPEYMLQGASIRAAAIAYGISPQ